MKQTAQNTIRSIFNNLYDIQTNFSYAASLIYTTAECMGKSDLSADSYETTLLGLFTFVDSLNKDLEEIINDLNHAIDE